ncbi:MAG: AraC family transcriptional regulator [Aliishimia sp.]
MIFDRLLIAAVSASFAIAVFAAAVSWSQRWTASSRAILAVFFAIFAISELDNIFIVLAGELPQKLRDGLALLRVVANFCLGPVFLLYVRELTLAENHSNDKLLGAFHFALPAAATLYAIIAMTLPDATRELWYTGRSVSAPPPGLQLLTIGFTVLAFALIVQWVVYLALVIRTQMKHLAVLKQHFSSTDGLELRWVAVLAAAMGTYVLQFLVGRLLQVTGAQDPIGPFLDSLLVLVVIASLALWGLRPSNDLKSVVAELEVLEEQRSKKYEKSALGADQSERIARKLVHAMEKEHLYRDPNLTLNTLSAHIGVSLNYVSQTLNQNIRQPFFEFVNSWRVKEAIPLVEEGASTVLAIAYEVGFNSRSSFYTAFKRETGMTPTSYKNAVAKAKTANDKASIVRASKP